MWWASSIWSGGHLHYQVLVLDEAIQQTHLQETLRVGMGRAQVAAILVQAKHGTGGPKSWPTILRSGEHAGRFVLVCWRWRQGKFS